MNRKIATVRSRRADAWTDHLIGFMAGDLSAGNLFRAAAKDDERAEAHYYRGMRLRLNGQPDDAYTEFLACVELNRKLIETDFARAMQNHLQQRDRPAEDAP